MPTGNYAVPAEIRAMKPRGTSVKKISGKYYVYELVARKGPNGKWGASSGPCIGRIDEKLGFIRNGADAEKGDVTVLEYGQYACGCYGSRKTLDMLNASFPPDKAKQVYFLALMMAVNGQASIDQSIQYYAMSYLSMENPELSMTRQSLIKLLEELGGDSPGVQYVQESMLKETSGMYAVRLQTEKNADGRDETDGTFHVLSVTDAVSGETVYRRLFRKKELATEFRNMMALGGKDSLFLLENAAGLCPEIRKALIESGRAYMAARRAEDNAIQELLRREPEKTGHFCLENARGTVGYGFREWKLDGKRIIAFMEESEGQKGSGGPPGKRKAVRRKQEQQTLADVTDTGLVILETNVTKPPDEVFQDYARAEKPHSDPGVRHACHAAGPTSLTQLQGYAFVMQVSGMIRRELEVCGVGSGQSAVPDALLRARSIKLQKMRSRWKLTYVDPICQKTLTAFHVDAKKYGLALPKSALVR